MFIHILNPISSIFYKIGLNDLVILEPQFITDLLSTIITTKHRFVKDGILIHRDLDQIW